MLEDKENNILHMLEHNLSQHIGNKKKNKRSCIDKCEKLQ